MKTLVARHPQALVWRGVVRAGALWFESGFIPEVEARRRILTLWQPGDRIERHESGLLLRFAALRRIVCARAPGAPLVPIGGRLLSAPLPELAVRELGAPEAAVVLVHADAPRVLPRGTEEDPSLWLEVGGWQVEFLKPLGEVPPPPDLLPAVLPDARAALGLAPADESLANIMEALRHPQRSGSLFGHWFGNVTLMLRHLLRLPERPQPKVEHIFQPKLSVLENGLFLLSALGILVLVAGLLVSGTAHWSPEVQTALVVGALAVTAVAYLIHVSGLPRWLSSLAAALHLNWLFRRPAPPPRVKKVVTLPPWLEKLLSQAILIFTGVCFATLLFANGKPLQNLWTGLLSVVLLVCSALFLLAFVSTLELVGEAIGYVYTSVTQMVSPRVPASSNVVTPRRTSDNFLGRRLMSFFGRAILLSRLGGVIGRRQAAYIGRMMEMFERGDFENALRHAIPLGGAMDLGSIVPALGVPQPRTDLQIQPHANSGGRGLMMQGLEEHLRPLYRRAFERLAEQGRFKEAAYVLAELLRADAEAVSFLEQHGELRLAAEVAEARKLAPDLVVRQWFLAGDRQRAVRVARLHSAFAGAIQRLEKDNRPVDVEALRFLWADALAQAGDFENAVEQVFAVEKAKSQALEHSWEPGAAKTLALEWMRLGIELGGASGARLLARQLQVPDADWEEAKPQVEALLAAAGQDAAGYRAEFARKLTQSTNPRTQLVARHTARVIWRDLRTGQITPATAGLSSLVRLAGDGALRADLPPAQAPPRNGPVSEFGTLKLESTDRGAITIEDAVLLPDGSCLVALGELGVRWLGRNGNLKAHFDQPAYRLVPFVHGNGALVLAPRGEATRMARLNLLKRICTFWHETIVDAVAPESDGALWFVAMNNRILAIDLSADRFGKLWDSGPLPGKCIWLEWTPKNLAAFVHSGDTSTITAKLTPFQVWMHTLPDLYLRSRTPVQAGYWESLTRVAFGLVPELGTLNSPPRLYFAGTITMPDGKAGQAAVRLPSRGTPTTVEDSQPWLRTLEFGPESVDGTVQAPLLNQDWVIVPVQQEADCTCYIGRISNGQIAGRIVLAGAGRINARLQAPYLTLCDDLGRAIVFNLAAGQIEKNWRVQ